MSQLVQMLIRLFYPREPEVGGGEVRVYPGRIAGAGEMYVTVPISGDHTVADLMASALHRFGLNPSNATKDYRCSEILLDRGGMLIFRLEILVTDNNSYAQLILFSQHQKG